MSDNVVWVCNSTLNGKHGATPVRVNGNRQKAEELANRFKYNKNMDTRGDRYLCNKKKEA